MNEYNNCKGVYRTSQATPGLLIIVDIAINEYNTLQPKIARSIIIERYSDVYGDGADDGDADDEGNGCSKRRRKYW